MHEPVYARVQSDGRYGDVLNFDQTTDHRTNDIDSWV